MRALLLFFCVITIAFLIGGNLYWKDKTSVSSFEGEQQVVDVDDVAVDEPAQEDELDEEMVEIDPEILEKMKNWPEEAQEHFQQVVATGDTYEIAIVGSYALGEGEGWAAMLQTELEDVYEGLVDVTIFEYKMTSIDFVEEGHIDEVKAAGADLILFEPFILEDNGYVEVERSHANIERFMEDMREANEDVVVILQPAHPIRSDLPYYAGQVDALESFAAEREIPYLDHWDVWPGQDQIANYVKSPVQYAPNEQGHQLWFEYAKEYFIAEE